MATIEPQLSRFPQVAELLARCEDKLGLLFRIYADRLPRHRHFWLALAYEKSELARLFREFDRAVASGKVLINSYALRMPMVVSYFNYINDAVQSAERGSITPIKALSIAVNIEQSAIKTRYLELLAAPTPDYKEQFQHLLDETRRQREMIQAQWENLRYARE